MWSIWKLIEKIKNKNGFCLKIDGKDEIKQWSYLQIDRKSESKNVFYLQIDWKVKVKMCSICNMTENWLNIRRYHTFQTHQHCSKI